MLFQSDVTFAELHPEEIKTLGDASLNVGRNVLLRFPCDVSTVAFGSFERRLAQGSMSLFKGNVSLGDQLDIVRRCSLERTLDFRMIRSKLLSDFLSQIPSVLKQPIVKVLLSSRLEGLLEPPGLRTQPFLLLRDFRDACELCCQILGNIILIPIRGQKHAGLLVRSWGRCKCVMIGTWAECQKLQSRTRLFCHYALRSIQGLSKPFLAQALQTRIGPGSQNSLHRE